MKKDIPVDKLLRWALCDEAPKGKAIAKSAWDQILSYSRLGTKIQNGRRPDDDWGYLPDAPHPDAELIVSCLLEQPDEMRLTEAECRDLIGHYADLNPNAARTVAKRGGFNPVGFMVSAGQNRNGFPWDCGGLPRARLQRHSNNNAVVFGIVDGEMTRLTPNASGSYRYADEPRALLEWVEPSIIELLEARVEYTVWHRGLCQFSQSLRGKLSEYEALPPSAAAAPWDSSAPPPSTFKDDPQVKMAKLPLSPRRAAATRPFESAIEAKARHARQKQGGAAEGDIAKSPLKYGVGGGL
jgi:hypothetical protein